jgi:hypothetical protein
MIEMIGDFDLYREKFDGDQRAAAIEIVAAVQEAFNLPPEALRFHNEMSQKSCPGTSINKQLFIDAIADKRGAGRAAVHFEGPFGNDQIEQPRPPERVVALEIQEIADCSSAITQVFGDARGVRAFGNDDELSEADLSNLERQYLETGFDQPTQPLTRGGGGERLGLTPSVFQALRPHLINLENGRLSSGGATSTSTADIQALFRKTLKSRAAASGQPLKILLYAHGGLVSEEEALAYAQSQYKWWLDNGVYPVFFIWETGPLEIALQYVREKIGLDRRDIRARPSDAIWERIARPIGRPLWSATKTSAARASEADGGARLVAEEMSRLKRAHDNVEFHLIGHSAGSIFHAYFLDHLAQERIPIESVQLLAPAMTCALYEDRVMRHINGRTVKNLRLFTMRRELERADPTMQHFGYGKSILYAVRNAFETEKGEPILGLEESIMSNSRLVEHFSIARSTQTTASICWSSTGDAGPEIDRSNSTSHGFDQDPSTMTAAQLLILGRPNSEGLSPFPPPPQRGRSGSRWAYIEEELLDVSSGTAPASPSEPVATPISTNFFIETSPAAERKALCIGIDYKGTRNELYGCIADAHLWGETLSSLGFQIEYLLEKDAGLENLIERITALIDGAAPGADIVLQYSGHGTHFRDTNGDEDDGQDEALVPFDADEKGYLVDDDLRSAFSKIRSDVNFTGFFDCCHSGTAARFGVGPSQSSARARQGVGSLKARFTPPSAAAVRATLQRQAARSRSLSRSTGADQDSMRHVQFGACLDHQYAYEENGQGKFSLVTTTVIRDKPSLSRRSLFAAVEAEFSRRRFRNQDPKLEGPASLKDAPLVR